MNGDYEWFIKANLNEYSGNWIAIVNKQVVASSKDVKDVLKRVKEQYPENVPFVTKIPERVLMVV